MESTHEPNRWVARWLFIVSCSVVGLVAIGRWVRLTVGVVDAARIAETGAAGGTVADSVARAVIAPSNRLPV